MEIDIKFDNFNKIFQSSDIITGAININSLEKLIEFQKIEGTLVGFYTIKNTKVSPTAISVIKFFTRRLTLANEGKM